MKSIELNTITFLVPPDKKQENQKWEEMGIYRETSESDDVVEKIVKYKFYFDEIVEVKETFIITKNEIRDVTVCTFLIDSRMVETPALLITYDDFLDKLDEVEGLGLIFKEEKNESPF